MVFLTVIVEHKRQNTKVRFMKKESFLCDFKVEGDNVTIICELAFYNPHKTWAKVKVTAKSPEDVKGGLLKEPQLTTLYLDKGECLTLRPESVSRITVEFHGIFAGTPKKENRLLPSIIMIDELQ
jgi:hypothetical protein